MAGRRHATIATTSNWIAALLLLAATATGANETPPEVRVVSSASLRSDAAFLRQTYEALHPDLYRYNTHEKVARRFAALDRAFRSRAAGDREAFLAFTRFTAAIRCGHSDPILYNQPREIVEALTSGSPLPPFRFV